MEKIKINVTISNAANEVIEAYKQLYSLKYKEDALDDLLIKKKKMILDETTKQGI